jgi:hypothetical protein
MPKGYAPGDILLAGLVFTSQTGAKRRPVMVISDERFAFATIVETSRQKGTC